MKSMAATDNYYWVGTGDPKLPWLLAAARQPSFVVIWFITAQVYTYQNCFCCCIRLVFAVEICLSVFLSVCLSVSTCHYLVSYQNGLTYYLNLTQTDEPTPTPGQSTNLQLLQARMHDILYLWRWVSCENPLTQHSSELETSHMATHETDED